MNGGQGEWGLVFIFEFSSIIFICLFNSVSCIIYFYIGFVVIDMLAQQVLNLSTIPVYYPQGLFHSFTIIYLSEVVK